MKRSPRAFTLARPRAFPRARPLLALAALLLAPGPVRSRPSGPGDLRVERITSEDGLSQSSVTCAFQDSRGFVWFGTQNGLNRYDGCEFRVFRHVPGDSRSLSENWVWSVYEDRRGDLWVGTFGGGACRFDRVTETFATFRHDPDDPRSISDNTVWCFAEDADGLLWVGANSALNAFDPEREVFRRYTPPGGAGNVLEMIPDGSDRIWLRGLEAIWEFDPRERVFRAPSFGRRVAPAPEGACQALALDDRGVLWLGTRGAGLYRIDPDDRTVTNYRRDPRDPDGSLADDSVVDVHVDSRSTLWAATHDGLSRFTFDGPLLAGVRNSRHDPTDPHTLSGNNLTGIYENRTGEIWIASRGGLDRYEPYNRKFRLFRSSPGSRDGLSHDTVLSIASSRRDPAVLWVGTRDGLNRLDRRTGRTSRFFADPDDPGAGPGSSYVLSLMVDRDGSLWVGTRGGGLSRLVDPAASAPRFDPYRLRPEAWGESGDLASRPGDRDRENVHCVYRDREGTLWVGTGGDGLFRLRPDGRSFIRYAHDPDDPHSLADDWIYTLLEDRRGRFWAGTANGGLNLLDRETGAVRRFRHDPDDPSSLSSDRVLSVVEASDGEIWIATAFGLNRMVMRDGATGSVGFVSYHVEDGLPNEAVFSFVEDGAGRFWASTDDGLCRIRVEAGRFAVRTFSVEDGLQGNEFGQNAWHRAADGWLCFGGLHGMSAFHPDSLRENPNPPPVVFTDFRILNESVPIARPRDGEGAADRDPGDRRLARSITETERVDLTHRDYVVSFEFAALNFTMPRKNRYAYRLEGFDPEWIDCGTRRFATYTNLEAGEYTFRVRAANNDGVWNEEGAALRLVVAPPPWETWWAYGLYVISALGVLLGFVRSRVRAKARELEARARIERARVEERERVRKKSSADFHDEAGNILTKITLFTELALRCEDRGGALGGYLRNIEENTKALSGRMRDFIWALDPEKDTLYDTLIRLKLFGNSLFQHVDIRFRTTGIDRSLAGVRLPMEERRAIVLIFKEAMTNVLKHSGCRSLTLGGRPRAEGIEIALTDDGVGFDPGLPRDDGYGLRNMAARAEGVGGSLEIRSKPGEGTVVVFRKRRPRSTCHGERAAPKGE